SAIFGERCERWQVREHEVDLQRAPVPTPYVELLEPRLAQRITSRQVTHGEWIRTRHHDWRAHETIIELDPDHRSLLTHDLAHGCAGSNRRARRQRRVRDAPRHRPHAAL